MAGVWTATYSFAATDIGLDRYRVQDQLNTAPVTVTPTTETDVFTFGQTVKIVMDGQTYSGIYQGADGGTMYVIVLDHPNPEWMISDTYLSENVIFMGNDPMPVCFVKGTLIDTNRGVVAIESLVPGDKVVGSKGLGTVKWVGWRHYHAMFLNTPAKRTACMPVRILAGALGDNQPSQDLRVSPWHHLLVDGVLVRANDLINGISIMQETNTMEFSYYHVELEQFDVIRAYGVYSESYADGGNRDFFQNVDVTTLRPEDKKRRLADRPGFTALRNPTEIAIIHDRIAARANACFAVSEAA